MLLNLLKAGVAVVVSPVAVVVDVVSAPFGDVGDFNKPLFARTAKLLNTAGACLDEAVKPSKE
jgi:hypothetical protein